MTEKKGIKSTYIIMYVYIFIIQFCWSTRTVLSSTEKKLYIFSPRLFKTPSKKALSALIGLLTEQK